MKPIENPKKMFSLVRTSVLSLVILSAAWTASAADLPIATGTPTAPTPAASPAVKSVKVDPAKEALEQEPAEPVGMPVANKDEKKPEKGTTDEKKPADKKPDDKKKDTKSEELSNDCCGHPGMIPVCRCVPVTKKRPKTEYEVKCELICVPGCGKFDYKHHGCSRHGCSDAGCTSCCDQPCCDNSTIRKKKTLMKKVVDEEYDAWEYKVEWICAPCAVGCCTPPGCCDAPGECGGHRRPHGLKGLFGWLFHAK